MSKAEDTFELIFKNNNVKYEREVSFDGLYGLNHMQLRFDFVLYNEDNSIKAIIELDGIQHYAFQKRFFKNFKEFNRAKEWDRRKNRYCLARKIPLYRIPYWEEKNIKNIEDIFQNKFLVKSQWHSDNMINELKEKNQLPLELKSQLGRREKCL